MGIWIDWLGVIKASHVQKTNAPQPKAESPSLFRRFGPPPSPPKNPSSKKLFTYAIPSCDDSTPYGTHETRRRVQALYLSKEV